MFRLAKGFFAALGFLTPLPVPGRWSSDEDALVKSVLFFPVVGLLIGFVAAGVDRASGYLFKAPLVTGAFTVVTLIAASKALHLDGLADTFDGFLSSRPKERVLEIMKDSRVGTMGVLAVATVLLLKWSAIVSLPENHRWQTLIAMPLAGRTALIVQMTLLPYARGEDGLAALFKKGCHIPHLLSALGALSGVGWFLMGGRGVLVVACAASAVALFAFYCHRKIAGFTGDTLGAGCELTELVPPLVVLASGDLFIWG